MIKAQSKRVPVYKALLFFAVFAFLFVCHAGLEAQPLKEIRIASSSTIGYTNLSVFYARDAKFFEREGYDVKIVVVQTSAALAALAAGSVDYTTLSTSAIEATLKGMPLRLIAVTVQYPVQGLVVRKEIRQVADLKGKKLGISSYGGTTYATAVNVLKHYGLNPKDVTILATGDTMARIAGLKYKTLDAAIINTPGDIKVAKEGFKILLDVGTIYKLLSGGLSTTVTKIRENPNEVRKIVRAVVLATKFLVDPKNKDEAMKYYTGSGFRLDRESAEDFYRRLVPSLSPTGMVDRDKVKLVIDSAVERGLIDKPVDPDAVVDFSFVKELGS